MNFKKILIASLFCTMIMFAGITAAFASPNVSSLLRSWFHTKSEQSIKEVDKAIDKELQVQSARLRDSLQPGINESKKEIAAYTEQQKKQKTAELKNYVDQLLTEKDVSSEIDKDKYANDLNKVLDRAKKQMNEVETKKIANEPSDKNTEEGDKTDAHKNGETKEQKNVKEDPETQDNDREVSKEAAEKPAETTVDPSENRETSNPG